MFLPIIKFSIFSSEEVYVRNIAILDKELDVIIIKQSDKEMIKRVIPVYETEEERQEFMCSAKSNGFSWERLWEEKMTGEALKRLEGTEVS